MFLSGKRKKNRSLWKPSSWANAVRIFGRRAVAVPTPTDLVWAPEGVTVALNLIIWRILNQKLPQIKVRSNLFLLEISTTWMIKNSSTAGESKRTSWVRSVRVDPKLLPSIELSAKIQVEVDLVQVIGTNLTGQPSAQNQKPSVKRLDLQEELYSVASTKKKINSTKKYSRRNLKKSRLGQKRSKLRLKRMLIWCLIRSSSWDSVKSLIWLSRIS